MSADQDPEKIPAYVVQKNNRYAVECQTKMAEDCQQNGEFCEDHEEAEEWVEDECWIFSGEGWICIACNEHIIMNLKIVRKQKGPHGRDDDLETGIDTVR